MGGVLLAGLPLWTGCALRPCDDSERAVLAEFAQYDGTQVAPEGNFDTGACAVYYEVPDPPDQARDYFVSQLKARGWTVDRPSGGEPQGGILVNAHRGPFSYVVYYEALASYRVPRPGTHLAVHVARE